MKDSVKKNKNGKKMVFFLDFSLFHEKLNSEGISGVKNEEPGALIG